MDDSKMAAALRLKGWRVEESITEENCKHPAHLVLGSGSMGADGSGSSSWHCRRCGASGKHSWPGNPNYQSPYAGLAGQSTTFQKLNFGPELG